MISASFRSNNNKSMNTFNNKNTRSSLLSSDHEDDTEDQTGSLLNKTIRHGDSNNRTNNFPHLTTFLNGDDQKHLFDLDSQLSESDTGKTKTSNQLKGGNSFRRHQQQGLPSDAEMALSTGSDKTIDSWIHELESIRLDELDTKPNYLQHQRKKVTFLSDIEEEEGDFGDRHPKVKAMSSEDDDDYGLLSGSEPAAPVQSTAEGLLSDTEESIKPAFLLNKRSATTRRRRSDESRTIVNDDENLPPSSSAFASYGSFKDYCAQQLRLITKLSQEVVQVDRLLNTDFSLKGEALFDVTKLSSFQFWYACYRRMEQRIDRLKQSYEERIKVLEAQVALLKNDAPTTKHDRELAEMTKTAVKDVMSTEELLMMNEIERRLGILERYATLEEDGNNYNGGRTAPTSLNSTIYPMATTMVSPDSSLTSTIYQPSQSALAYAPSTCSNATNSTNVPTINYSTQSSIPMGFNPASLFPSPPQPMFNANPHSSLYKYTQLNGSGLGTSGGNSSPYSMV